MFADMAELADALDLGSSGVPRAGSIPVIRIDLRESFKGSLFVLLKNLDLALLKIIGTLFIIKQCPNISMNIGNKKMI